MSQPVEKLRKIWSPEMEAAEMFADLNPQTELDSMVRHLLHAILEQVVKGPVQVNLEQLNTGTLRWEIVHPQLAPAVHGPKTCIVWVEGADEHQA
jgi:hypothetical protein